LTASLLIVFLGSSLWIQSALGLESEQEQIARDAEKAFEKIINLWKEEQYEELYDHGRLESQRLVPKQDFVRLMQDSPVRLQCCWATVQEVKGVTTSPTEVYVKAKLGYELFSTIVTDSPAVSHRRLKATSTFKEGTFLLNQEQGGWKIDLADLLSAAGYILKDRQILKNPLP
jgi:hypothetical protein